jgi:RNA polymerase sigma-70 factor, ECF subfamily
VSSSIFVLVSTVGAGTVSEETKRTHVRSPGRTGSEAAIEAEVIRRAKRGEEDAFATLYKRYKARAYSLCFRMVRNTGVAEELTQEAFLQVYRKLDTYRGDAQFSTWLHRLVVNVVLMHLRKRVLPQESLDEVMHADADNPFLRFGQQDRVLARTADRVALERTIAALPPGYRLVFILHDIQGYEHKEIADMLGCTIGNSKSQLHKARLRVRHFLLELTDTVESQAA